MSERWMPKKGEKYYWSFLNHCNTGSTNWSNSNDDFENYASGNCFRTVEEAKAASEKVKALLLSLHDNNLATNLQDKPLPKLTAEVFDRPDCPEWARYATVDRGGAICLWENKPKCDNVQMWLRGKVGVRMINYFGCAPVDSSDWQNSLIERPAKLPDWCKPGAWIYTSSEQYLKINGISIDLRKIELSNGATWSKQDIIDEAVPARLRPYNAEEMKALVGKVVEFDAFAQLVLMYDGKDNAILAGDGDWLSESTLLKDYTIDGKNCGVLEHLENGEWLE